MQKITPFLWFDRQAEEAVKFYLGVFRNSKITGITRYEGSGAKATGQPEGAVMTVAFQLRGQEFVALNGGPHFTFSPAISFVVNCETQDEVDEYWRMLSEGGRIQQCGWLQDKYGVSWQIVPSVLSKLLQDQDAGKRERVMQAMLQMTKLDIQQLTQA